MEKPRIVTNLNLDDSSRITGAQFVRAVIDNAKLMDSIRPRSVHIWTDERYDNGRRQAVTVEVHLRWNVKEKFYFYPLAAGFPGEPYYFHSSSWGSRFVMKSDPESKYAKEHFAAVNNWAYLFQTSLLDLLRSAQPAEISQLLKESNVPQ